jgi:hypothetical protein
MTGCPQAEESTEPDALGHADVRRREGGRMSREPLPPELPDVFSVRRAAAAGVGAGRLRADDLHRPFHGVRAQHPPESAVARASAFATRMGAHEFFTHLTAAAAWDAPLPAWCAHRPVDVGVLSPLRAPRGAGVHGHEVTPRLVQVVTGPQGWRTTDPASTWAQLGDVLTLDDLVAVGDAFVRRPRRAGDRGALTTLELLRGAVDAGRRPGVRNLREALPLVRLGVDSPRETTLRLLIVRAGLPEPDTAVEVRRDGVVVACVDLGYPRWRILLEYEGRQHLTDAAQWTRDIHRYERLASAGWIVLRVTHEDLAQHPERVIARLRAAIRSREPRSPG